MSSSVLLPIVVAAAVLAIAAIASARRKTSAGGATWPVHARPVMSKPEFIAYGRLIEALPEWLVFPQVQVGSLVEVNNVPGRQGIRNRFDRLSADFVVCGRDGSVRAVVELDDASHERVDARRRDVKKDSVLKAAGIRVVRIHVRRIPQNSELRGLVLEESTAPPNAVVAGRREPFIST
ncbi:MAG TPA: DUF2726 domain-containing protein [Steroidobacteraceae bacterium]